MPYEVPSLPYDYDALEPHIDEQTMRLHHDKHHQAYVDNANKALAGTEWEDRPVENVLANLEILPEDIRTAVRNNAGGHANHSLFWEIMSPDGGGEPGGSLAEAIATTFGSVDELKKDLIDTGVKRFGSGWSWLVYDGTGLAVYSTANQDSPISNSDVPLLGIDVWSTPTTSSTRTAGPNTSRPGGTSSTGTPFRRGSRARTSSPRSLDTSAPDDGLRATPRVDVTRRHLACGHVDPDGPAPARDRGARGFQGHDAPRLLSELKLANVDPRVREREALEVDEPARERLAGGHVEVEPARVRDERQLDQRLDLHRDRALGAFPLRLVGRVQLRRDVEAERPVRDGLQGRDHLLRRLPEGHRGQRHRLARALVRHGSAERDLRAELDDRHRGGECY